MIFIDISLYLPKVLRQIIQGSNTSVHYSRLLHHVAVVVLCRMQINFPAKWSNFANKFYRITGLHTKHMFVERLI